MTDQTAPTGAEQDRALENVSAILSRMSTSKRLRQRRFVMLPLEGPAAPVTQVQGRMPGDSTTPAELEGLISSIATVGILQPLLVEDNDGRHVLVAGERRLRALRWGHVNQPDNPHFQAVPAIVCPGPLTEEERRCWQLVENLAREDLSVGELGAALLFERVAVLSDALRGQGLQIPEDVLALEDPIDRWEALDKFRNASGVREVPRWEDVLKRVGIQLSVDKAKQFVRAFKSLPAEVSSEMDAEGIALATRLDFLRLHKGRENAAADIWAAVKAKGAPKLLGGAVRAAIADPGLEPGAAVEHAQHVHEAANAARSAALRHNAADTETESSDTDDVDDLDAGCGADDAMAAELAPAPRGAGAGDQGDDDEEGDDQEGDTADEDAQEVDPEVVGQAVTAISGLVTALRDGKKLAGYAAGTLLLHTRELLSLTSEGDAA